MPLWLLVLLVLAIIGAGVGLGIWWFFFRDSGEETTDDNANGGDDNANGGDDNEGDDEGEEEKKTTAFKCCQETTDCTGLEICVNGTCLPPLKAGTDGKFDSRCPYDSASGNCYSYSNDKKNFFVRDCRIKCDNGCDDCCAPGCVKVSTPVGKVIIEAGGKVYDPTDRTKIVTLADLQ